ncbi:MAG: metalloregulator ArsR/SmtB family transcription factor [Deltaproteobacteria bacterium]|nr:MAG: metalloregulator ArsR/SmtB family transcription factor [Deltaproteobacteria bacterium]
MEALSQAYRALGDATRLRILRLIAQTPLNVSEIVSLVGIAQPTVSHHLGKLKAMRLLLEERQGVFTYYSLDLHPDDPRWPLIRVAIDDRTDGDGDLARLRDLLRQRDDRQALNERLLEPGQSFQLWSRALGRLLPRWDVADLGCGTGSLSVEIARWARSVLAIDRNPEVLVAARERAARDEARNVEFVAADLHDFSTRRLHFLDDPPQVVRTARKLLKKGGRLLVLELLPHGEEWVRERLGHRYLGFDPVELAATLEAEGFASIITEILPSGSSPFRPFLLCAEVPE